MNENEQLIEHFYTCFQRKDYRGMQACYADDATFNDSVFKNLNARQARAMWEMLISKGKDLRLEFGNIKADDQKGSAHWDAYYTFSATGKKVVNSIDASFEFKDGKISKHEDHFNFYTWAKQAFGIIGLLLGWTSFLQKKVTTQAMKNLARFMARS
jgi:ketosteroid isomerase-like protein